VAGAVAAWWLVAQLRVAGRALVATPGEALAALRADAASLSRDLVVTAARSGAGLAVGVALGLALGALAAAAARRAPAVEGLLDFVRSIPPVMVLPVCLLAFGYNETARLATIAFGCVWTVALTVVTAALLPRSGRREVLDVAGATPLQAFAWTQPWESLGVLVVGLRASASTAVIVAVVTEMIAGTDRGLGARVVAAQIAGDAPGLTVDVLAAGALGYAVNLTLRVTERRVRSLGL
jgi:ABC-type nitrate/sulfonate/bicarbonate transport system permease component